MDATLTVNGDPCSIIRMMHERTFDVWETDDIETGTLRRTSGPLSEYSRRKQHALDVVEVEFVTEYDPLKIAACVDFAGKSFDRVISVDAEMLMTRGGLVSMRLASD